MQWLLCLVLLAAPAWAQTVLSPEDNDRLNVSYLIFGAIAAGAVTLSGFVYCVCKFHNARRKVQDAERPDPPVQAPAVEILPLEPLPARPGTRLIVGGHLSNK